jgi:hypothetical protein
MAEYIKNNQSKFSLLDTPEFQTMYSKPSGGGAQTQSAESSADESKSFLSPDVARATAYGAQSGGLSGALTSGGVTSMLGPAGMAGGGPYAVAGGLILSQIEAAQKAKAEAEQERIKNEKIRMEKTRMAYSDMANQRFGV